MREQLTLPPEGDQTFPDFCAWCGRSPATPYQLEKPQYTHAANGQRVIKRSALMVPVCGDHRRHFDASREDDHE